MIWEAAAVIALLLSTVCWWWTRNFNHWRVRGIPGPAPSLLYGNMRSVFDKSKAYTVDVDGIYQKYRNKGLPLVGFFTGRKPYLMAMDLVTVKEILVTNFHHFGDNEVSDMMSPAKDPVLNGNAFFSKGDKWKEVRQEASLAYTTSRIRTYYPIFKDACGRLTSFVERRLEKDGSEVDVDELAMKFAGDVVFDVGLGFRANALEEEESVALSNGNDYISQFQTISLFFKSTGILPLLKRVFRFRMLQPKTEQFFKGLIQRSLENRAEGGFRDDLVQFLHQLNQKKAHSTDGLLTHAMMFFLDAFDTSAIAMAKVLMELARNPDCQEKLRDEIRQAKDAGGGEISYDELIKLPYLEAVVFETLRINPPIALLVRQCTKTFHLQHPDHANPIEIQKGTPVLIPIGAIHRDEAYFENPLQFDPERFIVNDAKKLIREGMLLFFGAGPRICLGMKYGLSQVKAGVCEIIQNFHLSEDEERMAKEPFPVTNFLNWPQKRILLNFRKI